MVRSCHVERASTNYVKKTYKREDERAADDEEKEQEVVSKEQRYFYVVEQERNLGKEGGAFEGTEEMIIRSSMVLALVLALLSVDQNGGQPNGQERHASDYFSRKLPQRVTRLVPRRSSMLPQDNAAAMGLAMQSRAVDTRVQLEVREGEPKGTLVGLIPVKPGFTYRFNEPPQEFVLDPETGKFRTAKVLDREALSSDRFDLVVLSSQPTYPIEVRILVLDINDNDPEFPESSIAVIFSESAVVGTKLLLDAATDKDTLENGVVDDYFIVNGNTDGKFRLEVTGNPTGETSYLHLETTGKLDREQVEF